MSPSTASVTRWMWTWIGVGVVVVLVVIGFLVGISSSLRSIDAALFEAADAVTGIEGDTDPLPDHIQDVNASLRRVDASVEPLDEQATAVADELGSIGTTLEDIDGTLGRTGDDLAATDEDLGRIDTRLQTTGASLIDISGALDQVLQRARNIETTLEAAESPPDNLGAKGIFQRVGRVNVRLRGVIQDTGNIVTSLDEVNEHLTSICHALPPVIVSTDAGC